jgi:hypothetical protein
MSDTTIPALLEELREVEPLLWEKITYLDQGDRVIKFAYQVLDDFALDHLQGCIQRAIAEKGWSYQQILYQNPTIYEAYLIGHRETIRRASTPSAAILAAYIEAKGAMR